MADLVTHLCTALLPSIWLGWRYGGVLAVGSVLPDLGSRVPAMGLEALGRLTGWPPPLWSYQPFALFHMPVGMVLAAYLLAQLFHGAQRRDVFVWLCAGQALHLGLDVFQHHHGQGYLLLWPASRTPFEIGWIGSEATVSLAPALFAVTVLSWWARQR